MLHKWSYMIDWNYSSFSIQSQTVAAMAVASSSGCNWNKWLFVSLIMLWSKQTYFTKTLHKKTKFFINFRFINVTLSHLLKKSLIHFFVQWSFLNKQSKSHQAFRAIAKYFKVGILTGRTQKFVKNKEIISPHREMKRNEQNGEISPTG